MSSSLTPLTSLSANSSDHSVQTSGTDLVPPAGADASFGGELERLTVFSAPTHIIVSSFLRLSSTFELYRRAFSALGVPDIYLPHELPPINGRPDLEGLTRLLKVFRTKPTFQTIVISEPYKQAVLPFVDVLEERAKAIGAVNLIRKRGDQLIGDNLDGLSFQLGVQQEVGYSFSKKSVAFFGCGGVSSAVAFTLAPQLQKVVLIDIQIERAEILGTKLKEANPKLKIFLADRSVELNLKDYDVFYNGTGLGKHGSNQNSYLLTPLHAFDEFPKHGIAFDANYTPWETAFLRRFSALDYETVNGFSHMIGFATLHLSMITARKVDYSFVRGLADFAVPAASTWQ